MIDPRPFGSDGVPDDDAGFGPGAGLLRLSEAGERRRGEMLLELTRAVTRRRQRRTAARAGAAAIAAVLVVAAALRFSRGPQSPAPEPSVARSESPAPLFAHVRVESIVTDPALLETIGVATDAAIAAAAEIGDEELLEALEASGHSAGLVRFGDRTILTGDVAKNGL